MLKDDALATMHRQNEVIISLLARLAFGEEKIVEIVTRGKKNPEAYRKVYNALDGLRTGTELAAVAGVTQQAMSQVLQTWEQEGIVVNFGTEPQPRFKKLMPIPAKELRKREPKS